MMKMINSEEVKTSLDSMTENQFKQYCFLDNGEVLIGKNGEKYCFVVRGSSKRQKYKSTSFVKLDYEILENGTKQLLYTLQDNLLIDVFIKLLEDIVINIEEAPSVIEASYIRWLVWKTMFSNKKREILSPEQIRGLMGELSLMKGFLKDKYSMAKAVYAWGGADYNKKDFEIDDTWYEVKTTLKSPGEAEITSLEQLESNIDGYLVVHSLEKSTLENVYATNLNKLVDECLKLIDDADVVDVFMNKLSEQGFAQDDKYNEYNYTIKKTGFYKVNNEFPRLTTSNVSEEIIKCVYTLSLNAISKFEIKKENI